MSDVKYDYNKIYPELEAGWGTAFFSDSIKSNSVYRPKFLSNNRAEGRKVLSDIMDELSTCVEFTISVAFITMNGITPLLMTLKDLEKRGVKGRILTTDYLTFSEPKALDKLASFKNIDLRLYRSEGTNVGFHTKGYYFKQEDIDVLIIGSSNLTANALTTNKEWNTRLISTKDGELINTMIQEFDSLWNSERSLKYEDIIDEYRTRFEIIKEQRRIAKDDEIINLEAYRLTPNKMQVAFINEIRDLIARGADRGLLISATGTGKTYAAAFGLRDALKPKKALFVVHREQIAKQARASFKKVYGSSKTYGLISGNSKDYDADITFATMQMMSKKETLEKFGKSEFDVIIIDEVHRAGAESYRKIMHYVSPKFWLGMTASPERSDGFDIYDLFDHNIACEIRLEQALDEDLLCPFHYFGITEISVDGEILDEELALRDFSALVSDQRIDHIIEQAEYYGHSGDRVKGLVFCSRRAEANELSAKFNARGYRTVSLGGNDSQDYREECVERLVSESNEDALDYIFTVDIFNEGVDLPPINQVIMLRPTESPIIFIQQLGRGLRKWENKDYVVILDFIGNYSSNFMITVALSGDRSYNKDTMRRYVSSGARVIPGASSIHFDEIAQKQIYASIDNARTNDLKLIRESYQNLKNKLGRIPNIKDFELHGEIDIKKIFDKMGSYHSFLSKYERDYNLSLNTSQEAVVKFVSTKLATGKRSEELEIIKRLINGKSIDTVLDDLTARKRESVFNNLTNKFAKNSDQDKYKSCVFLEDGYRPHRRFMQSLEDDDYREMLLEIVEYGLGEYDNKYSVKYKDTDFSLGEKYSYEDACLLLCWERDQTAVIGGYFYDKRTKTLPVFINYDKSDDAIPYEDRFVTPRELIALSKHPRKTTSSDADHIYKRTPDDENNRIFLFVRKNKDDKEAKEFYFLGEMEAKDNPRGIIMPDTKDDAFEIDYMLETPVKDELYRYIIG